MMKSDLSEALIPFVILLTSRRWYILSRRMLRSSQ